MDRLLIVIAIAIGLYLLGTVAETRDITQDRPEEIHP